MQDIKQSKSSVMLAGIVSILMGLLFFGNPGGATVVLTRLIGWIAIISGALAVASAFHNQNPIGSSADLYIGIVALVFGLFLAMQPAFFVAWIFVLIGIFVAIEGFHMLMVSNMSRAAGMSGAVAQMILSVIVIIGGIIIIGSPFTMVSIAGAIAGIFLVINGVSEIARGIKM